MFTAVHKRVWSPCCAEHHASLLWCCYWCSALGGWALGPLKCSGSSQICGMFCTKLLLGVPAVSCVPSAHFCRQIFSWLISHFLFTSQPTIFYSFLCTSSPSQLTSFGVWVEEVSSFPLVPQIPYPKCLGQEKIPSVQQDRDGQLVPV